MQLDLVIFDCDGVLVDSEVISCRAHAETLTRHGYPITAEQVLHRFLGVSDREARLTVERELGRQLPEDFEAQMKQAALQRYPSELGAIPHIGEAIAAIAFASALVAMPTHCQKLPHELEMLALDGAFLIAVQLAAKHGMTNKAANLMMEDMVTMITKHLKKGARIRLNGLGILQVRKRAARMERNPATGEAIKIKASKKIAFRAAKDLKAAI